MSRYIDADDVANAIYHHFPSIRTMADARGIIEEAPSIDIVRCKECKHWDTKWIPSGEDDDVHWCSWKDLVEYGDWYCADGKRKENE